MKQIRNNVFETNSSSSHSLTIGNNKNLDRSTLQVSYNKRVAVEFGEFGWGYTIYTDQETKLSYLCTLWWETECRNIKNIDDIFKTEGYILIDKAIAEYCNCSGIFIADKQISIGFHYDNNPRFNITGYIDHQSSYEDYSSIQDFLNYYKITIIDFIFNSNIELVIDNDN